MAVLVNVIPWPRRDVCLYENSEILFIQCCTVSLVRVSVIVLYKVKLGASFPKSPPFSFFTPMVPA
eukprot:SAG31_NODE_4821_length_2931_cov_1.339689_4_plen_66_part_00